MACSGGQARALAAPTVGDTTSKSQCTPTGPLAASAVPFIAMKKDVAFSPASISTGSLAPTLQPARCVAAPRSERDGAGRAVKVHALVCRDQPHRPVMERALCETLPSDHRLCATAPARAVSTRWWEWLTGSTDRHPQHTAVRTRGARAPRRCRDMRSAHASLQAHRDTAAGLRKVASRRQQQAVGS